MTKDLIVKKERAFIPYLNGKKHYIKNTWEYQLFNSEGVLLSELCVRKESGDERYCNFEDFGVDKSILYIHSFNTLPEYRKMGYGRFLLKNILSRFKGKYDLIHLDVCPYFEAEKENGLCMSDLLSFYESFGFKLYKSNECYNTMLFGKY